MVYAMWGVGRGLWCTVSTGGLGGVQVMGGSIVGWG